jgi:hypothetical protein
MDHVREFYILKHNLEAAFQYLYGEFNIDLIRSFIKLKEEKSPSPRIVYSAQT